MEHDLIERENLKRDETIIDLTGAEIGFLKRFRLVAPDDLEGLSPELARQRIQQFMNEPVGEERMRTLSHYGLADPLEKPVTGAEYLARRTMYDSLKVGPKTRQRLQDTGVDTREMKTLTIGEARKILREIEQIVGIDEQKTEQDDVERAF